MHECNGKELIAFWIQNTEREKESEELAIVALKIGVM